MTFLHFKECNGLRAFASLNMPNNFKFIIDNHNYYMPQILADFLSPAVAEMHLYDPTVNYFLISDVSDQNFDFELFMLLAGGRTIEITPENGPFIEIVASKLMNEEIVKASSEYLNQISPITIDNVIYRLNQKISIGILPLCEIQFIAENFWVINPNFLFQIQPKELNLVLSHPKLKIINEDWLFQLILKFIKDKGDKYRISLSYVSFNDLNMNSIRKYFENSEVDQIDEFIFRSVREKLTLNNENKNSQTHNVAIQSEINYVYQKSKKQTDSNGYSFNSEFFSEHHIYDDQQTFEYISSLFENSSATSSASNIYNFNAKFNPFEPNPKKPFPDHFSKINSKNKEEEEREEKKREPLIQDELFPFYNAHIDIHHSGDSEQIPIHFTNKVNYDFSSSSDENDNKNSQESFFDRIANQVFNTSQKIFNNHDQKTTNESEEKETNQNGIFSSIKNGFLNLFTTENKDEPKNIIPREEELTSFKPEPLIPNQKEKNSWPFPLPSSNNDIKTDNEDLNENREKTTDNNENNKIHVSIHDSNDDDNRVNVNKDQNNHQNLEQTNDKPKSDDDDSDLGGYGGFAKEQY